MINYFERDLWMKLPVPRAIRIHSVQWNGSEFVFFSSDKEIKVTPERLRAVMINAKSDEVSESEVESTFEKLARKGHQRKGR